MERQSTRLIIIGLLLSVINLFVISCGQDAFVTLSVFFLLFMLSSQSWISLLFVRLRQRLIFKQKRGVKGIFKASKDSNDPKGMPRKHDLHASTARAHRQTKRD